MVKVPWSGAPVWLCSYFLCWGRACVYLFDGKLEPAGRRNLFNLLAGLFLKNVFKVYRFYLLLADYAALQIQINVNSRCKFDHRWHEIFSWYVFLFVFSRGWDSFQQVIVSKSDPVMSYTPVRLSPLWQETGHPAKRIISEICVPTSVCELNAKERMDSGSFQVHTEEDEDRLYQAAGCLCEIFVTSQHKTHTATSPEVFFSDSRGCC